MAPTPARGGLPENVAAALSYLTVIPAIIFLLLEPYHRNRLVRFHAWQSILLAVAAFVLSWTLSFLGAVTRLYALAVSLESLVSLAIVVFWIMAMVNAWHARMFKLPVIGDQAEKLAA